MSVNRSRLPRSSQTDVHPRLDEVVRRHLGSTWRAPIHAHTRAAFESVAPTARTAGSVILDSGCGTGHSTAYLAGLYPRSLVVGVDKSCARLAACPELPANAIVVRAELADFWRLAAAAGWSLSRHCLFYPNPWPKPGHLRRRWHAHPVFPALLALGGAFELRTNFEIYAREFARALELAGAGAPMVVSFSPDSPVSPFERKYADSGHRLYKLIINLEDSTT